jgi:hypothetical protein
MQQIIEVCVCVRHRRLSDRLQRVVVQVLDRARDPAFGQDLEQGGQTSTVWGRSRLVMTTGACCAASWNRPTFCWNSVDVTFITASALSIIDRTGDATTLRGAPLCLAPLPAGS